jgi:hypothetical protein
MAPVPRSFAIDHSDAGARARLRNILRYQVACELAQRTRQALLVTLAALSGVLWLATARRSLVPDPIVGATLAAWAAVLAGVIGALVAERTCRKRQDTAIGEGRFGREEGNR